MQGKKSSRVTSIFVLISKINGDGDSTGQSEDDNIVRPQE